MVENNTMEPPAQDWLDKAHDFFRLSVLDGAALVSVTTFILFYHYQFQSAHIPGTDGFYHIKYAYMMRIEGFLSNFRWATLSLWYETFYDKELLYHIYLIPFTYFKDLEYGAKLGTTVLGTFSITSFYLILRFNKIRFAEIWWLLLIFSGGYFLYRNNVPRPQVLSIVLSLWTIHFVVNRMRVSLFTISMVYTFSYTAYFLPFVFACIMAGYLLVFERELEWKTPAVALVGMLVAMLCHPYFPNNIIYLYLQNFYVLWQASQGGGIDLRMGGEFGPMTTRKLLDVNTSVILPYAAAFFLALFRPVRINKQTKSLFFISLALIILTLHTKRFAEYSVPVTLMFCAFYFQHHIAELDVVSHIRESLGRTLLIVGIGVAVIAVLGIRSYRDVAPLFRVSETGYKGSALYLKKFAPKGQVVYTCDWDDAPALFFYNHTNRYIVFLDPNFMYFWNPKMWHKWNDLSFGHFGKKTYKMLKNDFKVTYGTCTSDFWKLRSIIRRHPKMKIVYSDRHGYVFKVN